MRFNATTNTLTVPNIIGNVSGFATNIVTTPFIYGTDWYVPFCSSGSNVPVYVNTAFRFDATTCVLSGIVFQGNLIGVAQSVKIALNNNHQDDYLTFTSDSSGGAGLLVNSFLRFNSVSGALTSTSFSGNLTGVASSVKVTQNSTGTSDYITFTSASSGGASLNVNSSLRFDSTSGILTSTSFSGNLTGVASSVKVTPNSTDTSDYIPFTSASSGGGNLSVNSSLKYNASTSTLSSAKIECGGLKSTGASDFTGVTTVPSPTTPNSTEVVNTQYLTSILSNYSPVNNGSPTGTIITFAVMATSLQGYLLCDGSSFDPAIYPNLYAVIGTQFGGTIYVPQLPDYRGSFLRGYNNGSSTNNRGVTGNSAYLSAAIGTMQTDQVGSHTHVNPNRYQCFGGTQRRYRHFNDTADPNEQFVIGTNAIPYAVEYNIPSGENRPVNFSVYYYIKT